MGQLTDLGFATADVTIAEGRVLALRAISLDDAVRIARLHGSAFEALFARITGADVDLDLDDTKAISMSLLTAAPDIAADIIAHAADDPSASGVARRLSFPVQLECLDKIGTLTFSGEDGPKKFLETVTRMMAGATSLTNGLRQPLNGSTESVDK